MGELPDHRPMENAMALAQQPVFSVNAHLKLGLAWQNVSGGNLRILDKNGGTEQHLDLYRVRPAAEDRRRYSR